MEVSHAQDVGNKKFKLDWKKSEKIIFYSDYQINIPLIDKAFVDYERKLPIYFSKWETQHHQNIETFQLTNVVYESLPPSQLFDIPFENIPSELEVDFKIVSTRNLSEAYFQMIPLVKDGNQVKKIISFELEYKLKSNSNSLTEKRSASNSVLSSGNWYKIAVDTTGIYKIDRSFLSNLGINVNNLNPKNIQIYGNGGGLLPYRIGDFRYDDLQENAIFVQGELDGRFDNEDYILFYARGPQSWKHSNSVNSLYHVKNIYDDKAYYFVHVGNQEGKRIVNATAVNGTTSATLQNFDDYWFYEKDQVNLQSAGQQWFSDDRFDITNQKTFSYNFTNLETTQPVKIKIRVAGVASSTTSFQVKANGTDLFTLPLSAASGYTLATTSENFSNTLLTSDQINLLFTYNNNGNSSAKGYLDYLEIIGKRKLIAGNKTFSFRNFASISQSGILTYQITNASSIFKIWDVTDPINPSNILNLSTGTNFEFNANGGILREYILLNSQNYLTPTRPTDYMVENQNLHSLTDVDYLIITKKEFASEAERIAQHHRTQSGMNVKVVPLYQIYNEFGSGSSDITAIRDFVRNVYVNSNNRLKYLLLFGDGSFDFKGIKTDKGIVPAFQSYLSFDMSSSFVTDDYYAIVSDLNEGDLDASDVQTQDIAVARIPFNNAIEAQQITTKILNYYSENSLGDWRNEILMIADDTDATYDEVIQQSQEILADNIKLNKPLVNNKKLWMDAFPQEITAGGSRYPQVNSALNNAVEKGVLMINYFGHGGETGLSLERVVETDQIESWNNLNTLNLFTVISCEFARFDNPYRPNTAGELVIRNSKGGAAHEIATARAIYITTGDYFNHNLMPLILNYNNTDNSIAENLRLSKNTSTSKQRYFIFSFGDPAMKLALPKPDVRLTHMNGIPITQSMDTIKALSHISFDGIVTQTNGQIDPNFNGEVFLTVFDKPMDRQTLNNDGISQIMTFDTQESKLFRGRATVTNGIFHIEFVTPQDIRIAYGKGKLSFYAHNNVTDKGGYNTDIVIGGINYNAAADNTGPIIKLL